MSRWSEIPGGIAGPACARIAAFAYHEVTDDPRSSGFQRTAALPYKHGCAAFDEHLEAITRAPVSPSLVTAIDLTRPLRHVLLTFDDGGKSALQAADALSQRGWRGHFFIVTSLIGRQRFLDAEEIRQLRRDGHVIGSHSHTHPDIFRELSGARMVAEWRESADRLANVLGETVDTASVPGGDISPGVLRSASEAGLRVLFTSEPWLTPRRVGDCWILGRFCPKSGTPSSTVGALASFQGWRRALLVRRLKVLARACMPALYRVHVRRSTQPFALDDHAQLP